MLDLQRIRKDPEEVRGALAKRGADVDFGPLLEDDRKRRELIAAGEAIKAERNRINKEIPRLKKEGNDVAPLLEQMKQSGDEVRRIDEELRAVDARMQEYLSGLPNIPADDVEAGGKENNKVIATWGEKPAFDGFTPKNHVDLCTELGLIDYERGVKMAGAGFWLYTGVGAQLEWALLNFFVQEHLKDGYTFMLPPHLLLYESGFTAGQFPKFEEDVFRLQEENFRFLLPTAETALINLYRDEILDEADLPRRLFAYTPCYRREAGSYRANERGMIRGHQFNKVEMFGFTKPEDSAAMLQELIRKACSLVEKLGLHYQLTKLAAGDCSASMATTYDVEIWMPSMEEYKEVSSVSNAHDYQARRGQIRYRRAEDRRPDFVHTLNGSGMATSRLIPAIVEQFQRADGSVAVPEVLRDIVGTDVIAK